MLIQSTSAGEAGTHRLLFDAASCCRAAVLISAGGVVALALLGTLAWLPALARMADLDLGVLAIAPLDAAALLAMSGALLLYSQTPRGSPAIASLFLAALAVPIVMIRSLLSFAVSLPAPSLTPFYLAQNARDPSLLSSVALSVGALAVLLVVLNRRRSIWLGDLIGWLAFGLVAPGLLALLGFGLLADPDWSVGVSEGLAALFLGLGVIAAGNPRRFPLRLFFGASATAVLLQASVPIVVFALLTYGVLFRIILEYDGTTRALSTVLVAVAFASVVGVLAAFVLGRMRRAGDGMSSVVAPVDEQREGEWALEAALREWQTTFDSMSDALCLLSLDGTILRANRAMATLTGVPSDDLVGRRCFNVVQNQAEPHRVCPLVKTVQTGSRQSAVISIGERWYEVVVDPVPGKNGEIISAIHRMTDVTGLRQLQHALQISEERYRRLFNSGYDMMFVHSISSGGRPGRIREVNDIACRRLGYTRDELLRLSLFDVSDPIIRDGERDAMHRLANEGHAIFEMTLIPKSGPRVSVEVSGHVFEYDGQPAVVAICRDITERKRLEAAAVQTQKMEMVGRLAGGVAHDFNNLLTAIIGYGNLAHNSLREGDPARTDIEQTLKAAERAQALTQRLLAFSRRQILSMQVLDLNDLISDLEPKLRRLASGVQLIVDPEARLWSVRADPEQVEQIVTNVVVNARDAMPRGGRLIISTANVILDEAFVEQHADVVTGEFVLLSLQDSGVGMDEEAMSHLFEPFFTTKSVGMGSGLGLATVYGIVRQHEGYVLVDSEAGLGTTVHIYLPRAAGEAPGAVSSAESALPRGNETVLVVEEEPLVRDMTTRLVRELGYQVLSAEDCRAALRLAAQHAGSIDLLLCDVSMAAMSGVELHKELIKLRPKLRVLFMSSYLEEARGSQSNADAALEFIEKPFGAHGLAQRLRKVLDRR